jgi:hypothetical protein
MPTEELESLISGYKINQAPLTEDLPSFSAAPGVSIADYQKIVDSGKPWFSEDLTSDYGGKDAVYFRTPEQIELEQDFYQNNWEKAGAGILRTVNKFASEIAKVPGYVGGLTEAAFTDASIGESLDNWWVNGIQEWENYANEELLKVYVPDSVRYGGLWDNLSSASFWATEGADGVGFLTSMLVPGNALKLLKLGQRGVNLFNAGNTFLRTAKGLSKGLTKTGALRYAAQGEKLGMRAARNFDDFTAATVNATLEASAEAKESFDNTLDAVVSNYMKVNNIDDASQIDQNTMMNLREQAGGVAADVFKFNMALLMVPNLMDQKALFGAFDSRKSALGKLFSKEGILQDFSSKTLKQQSLGYLGALGKGIAKEGFFEEGMQFTGAEYFKDQAMLSEDEQDKTYYQKLGGLVDSYIENLGSTDMQKSIALGGILGGGMSVVGQVKNDRYQTKYGSILHAQLKNNLIDRMKGVADVFEKDDNGKIIIEKGTPKINQEKFQELLSQPENKMMLNKLADIAALLGDKEDYNLIQSILDYNYFQPFFEQGQEGIQILKNHITSELSKSELEKQDVEELLGLTGSATQAQRMSNLLQRVDEYYELYDSVNNRHEFDMPSLQGGSKSDRATFSQLIRNKKLEKVLLNSELKKVTNSLNQQVFSIVSKNLVNQEDPTTLGQLSESDKKELELLYGKEAQYKKQLDDLLEDEKALYSKEAIQEEYAKFLANKEKKELEKKEADSTDEQIKDKFAKDLADAGYKMDIEHTLDPEVKDKLSPEELEKYKGNDRFFYFELNGKEYEAYSERDITTGKLKRLYRDSFTKEVKGEFTTDFLKKNKGVRIINKQEAFLKRKLERIRKSKIAKLRAFEVVYDKLWTNLSENKGALQDASVKRAEIKTQIEFYENWIKEITNEFGRANNGKAQEKKQLQAEIKRLEDLLIELDIQIEDLNAIYDSLTEQLDLLYKIKEDFQINKQDGNFKTEQDNILFDEFTRSILNEINKELESLVEEERQLNENLQTAEQAVAKAEQELNNALDLRTELQIILEDLNRIKDINEIIQALLTADFNSDFNKDGSPNKLKLIAARYKPFKLIFNSIEKLRNNVITDEEYIKIIQVANNLLTDQYLGFGTESLLQLTTEIKSAAKNANQIPLDTEVQFYIDNHYFYPNRMIDKIVGHKQRLLESATKYYFDLSEQQIAQMGSREMRLLEMSQKENNLKTLMNDLFIQYKNKLNRTPGQPINYNNQAPTGQAPTVYEEEEIEGKPDFSGFLSNYIFRSIALDLLYDDKTKKTSYPDNNNGLPELNENDENYRRLSTFIKNNPDLAKKYNVRFFIGRTDEDGNVSLSLGGGQTSSELLNLYKAIPEGEEGRKPGDLSIGFYLEDEKGNLATETYANQTKLVVGFIPKSITSKSGALRINNAAAVSLITNGFNIRKDVKFINNYQVKKEDGVYTFAAKNYNKDVDVTVTIKDGKAIIETRYDAFIAGTSALEISESDAEIVADYLKDGSNYAMSKAGKKIVSLLMNSKIKYQSNIVLSSEKTNNIENSGVYELYGEITIDELIAKAKEIIGGDKGLYQEQVINTIVNHIETENKKAYSGISLVTGGVPIIQYETDENGKPMFNKPVQRKITKALPVKVTEKGILEGGDIEVVDYTTQTLYTPGKIILKMDKTNEVVPLSQRTLTADEILTALYIMSTADEGNVKAPDFGDKKFMRIKKSSSSDEMQAIGSYLMLPFNSESNVSAITSLLYWGRQLDKNYIDQQGNEIPIASDKVSEIFYHNGEIHFKKKLEDGKWIQTSLDILTLKKALASKDPLQNPLIEDLVTYLADKRLNVNKQLLGENTPNLYFHPVVKRTADGKYEMSYKSYPSYRIFLVDSVLRTSLPSVDNFPKFANKMIVFKRISEGNTIKVQLNENFIKPSDRPENKKVVVSKKKEKFEPAATKSGLDASKMSEEGKKALKEAASISKFQSMKFKNYPDGLYTIDEETKDSEGNVESVKQNTFVVIDGVFQTSDKSNSYSEEDVEIFKDNDVRNASLKQFSSENKVFRINNFEPLVTSKEEEVADEIESNSTATVSETKPTETKEGETKLQRFKRRNVSGLSATNNLSENEMKKQQGINCPTK